MMTKVAHENGVEQVPYQTVGLDVEVYDQRFAVGDPLLENDVEFFIEYAQRMSRHGRGPILELGAGTGRISWELGKAGCYVTGLDISPLMVKIARDKRAQMSPEVRNRVNFIEGDMTRFDLGETYPLIIIPARSFQCLESAEDQKRCLRRIHRHLETGGCLIIDVFDPRFDPYTQDDYEDDLARIPTVKHPKSGNTVHIEFIDRAADMMNQTIEEVWRYTEVDKKTGSILRAEDAQLKMRWSFRQEMRNLFELCGFEVESEFSDFYKSSPQYGKEQIWVVRKA